MLFDKNNTQDYTTKNICALAALFLKKLINDKYNIIIVKQRMKIFLSYPVLLIADIIIIIFNLINLI